MGQASWNATRRIMDILTSFSPYWGDLWACYLEVEIEGFRVNLRKVRRLRSYARRGHAVWTRNHDHFEEQRQHSWDKYHPHSMNTDKGFSSICKTLTKTEGFPATSVGLGAPLSNSDQELNFVYFGETGSIGMGIANESVPLHLKPHETGREQKAWYFASAVLQQPYSTVTGQLNVVVVQARSLRRSEGIGGVMQRCGVSFGLKPFVQLSINSGDSKAMPREWRTTTVRGLQGLGSSSLPVWNEKFCICLRGNEVAVRLEVLTDTFPRPALLGSARIPINLLQQGSMSSWVPVYNGVRQVGQVLLRCSYSVPPREINVTHDEAEALSIFRRLHAHKGGQVDCSLVLSELTLLGYPQDKVDERIYLADPRCSGKMSYMQYWNGVLPHVFEEHMRQGMGHVRHMSCCDAVSHVRHVPCCHAVKHVASSLHPSQMLTARGERGVEAGRAGAGGNGDGLSDGVVDSVGALGLDDDRKSVGALGLDDDRKIGVHEDCNIGIHRSSAHIDSKHLGAALVRVDGVVLHSETANAGSYEGINGQYQRSNTLCNRRAVYTKVGHSKTCMWWGNVDGKISWCLGPKDMVGGEVMWAFVESMGLGPEEAGTRAWTVFNSKSASWEEQNGICVVNCDPPALMTDQEEAIVNEMSSNPKKACAPLSPAESMTGHSPEEAQHGSGEGTERQGAGDEMTEVAEQVMSRSILFSVLGFEITVGLLRAATQLDLPQVYIFVYVCM